MSESKLKNIKAIGELLQGNHSMQNRKSIVKPTNNADSKIKRVVGEIWPVFKADGLTPDFWYEQMDGFRRRHSKDPREEDLELREYIRKMNSYFNCLPDCHTIHGTKEKPGFRGYSALDKKFLKKFNRCADCQFRVEDDLKLKGLYKEYEQEFMKNNAIDIIKDMDQTIVEYTKSIHDDFEVVINADGITEKHKGSPELAEAIQSEYDEFKNYIMENLINE